MWFRIITQSQSLGLRVFQAGQSNWPGQLPAVAVPSPSSGSPAWPLSIRSLSQQAARRRRSQSCRRGPFAPEARLSRPESSDTARGDSLPDSGASAGERARAGAGRSGLLLRPTPTSNSTLLSSPPPLNWAGGRTTGRRLTDRWRRPATGDGCAGREEEQI